MLRYWEDPEPDDERDDEGEEWKQGAREAVESDSETVERFLEEIDVAIYDRTGSAVSCPEEPAAWQLALWGRLPKAAADRLYGRHNGILARWPRICACGREFRGPQRQTMRCATCRRPGRVEKGGRR
jgi:hypothetical protein